MLFVLQRMPPKVYHRGADGRNPGTKGNTFSQTDRRPGQLQWLRDEKNFFWSVDACLARLLPVKVSQRRLGA